MTLHTTASADGTPIAYEKSGQGAPVVLVTGALCTRKVDTELVARLAGQFTVYSYDRRGRGDSVDALAGQVPARDVADREVEDLAAVVAAAGGRAAAFGMSSGAALVLRAAAGGVPLTQVAVYEPPFRPADSSDEDHEKSVAELVGLLAAGDRDGAVEYFISGTGAPPEVIEKMRSSPEWAEFVALAPTIGYDYAIMGDGLVPADRLASIAAPVLAMGGGAGLEWMRDAARAVADAVPDGRYVTIEDQMHEVEAQALAPLLAKFFAA